MDQRIRLLLQAKYWDTLWRFIKARIHKTPRRFAGWQLIENGESPAHQFYLVGFEPRGESVDEPQRLFCYPAIQQLQTRREYEVIRGIFFSRKTPAALAGCGKRFLKVASDIAIVSCDMSTGANITD
jgi:hypothetical protein